MSRELYKFCLFVQIISAEWGDFLNRQEYIEFAESRAKRTTSLKNCIWAFIVGGLICVIGQLLMYAYINVVKDEKTAYSLASVTLVFLSGLLTGIGRFDKLASRAGAGTLVPITGFANAVASPAIEAKSEGYIKGVAAQMFVIAGPVIVYGSASSVIYGIIYYISMKIAGQI